MGIFDDAKTVMIGNKEVQSIITSNGGVIYEKPSGWSLVLTGDKSVMMTGETATLTATLTNNNVPQSGKSIIFCDANYTPFVHSYDGTYNLNRHLGNSFSIYYLPQGGTHISIDSSNLHIILTNSGLVRMSDDNHTWTNLFTTKTSLNLNNGVLFDDEGHSYDISSYDNDFTLTTVFGKGKVYFEFYGVAVTNNNGVATVSYTGKGAGQLNIQAYYSERIISSIIYVTDGVYIDIATTGKKNANWYNSSSIPIVTDDTGSYWEESASSSSYFTATQQTTDWGKRLFVELDCIVEFDLLAVTDISLVAYDSNSTVCLNYPMTRTGHIKLFMRSTGITMSIDGGKETDVGYNNPLNTINFGFNNRSSGTVSTFKYKNFVIYPL